MSSLPFAAHHHPQHAAVVFAGIAAYKYIKFRLLCWRRDYVNEKVRGIIMDQLTNQLPSVSTGASGDVHVAQLSPDLGCACVFCGCPQWVRHNQDDILVQLHPCGCTLHLQCFIQAATTQRGIKHIWHSENCEDLVVMARRFFGIESVLVNSLECPGCALEVNMWQCIPEKDSGINTSACVVSCLQSGRPLCVCNLQKALLECHSMSPLLCKWREAANSEEELLELLQKIGSAAKLELKEIFTESEDACLLQTAMSILPQRASKKLQIHNMVAGQPSEEPMQTAERSALYRQFIWIPANNKIPCF